MQKFNKTKFLKTILFIFLTIILFKTESVLADWQSDLDAQFDIVETFDELKDWKGINGLKGQDINKSHMPVKEDGSPSMWDFYDEWSELDPQSEWIAFHGESNTWRSQGKSLKMYIPKVGSVAHNPVGAQRFGLYFGSEVDGEANPYAISGTKDSGYDDLYLFYMIKMPYNHFPRDGDGNFIYYGYYKLFALCAGFLSIDQPYLSQSAIESNNQAHAYGPSHILPTLKTGSSWDYEMLLRYGLRVHSYENWDELLYESYVADDNGTRGSSLKQYIDNELWYGIEIHQTTGTPGNNDAVSEVWLYDSDGTARKIFTKTDGFVIEGGQAYRYNKFFFGGNQDFQDTTNVDSTYYIDDFIIDDQRIGPTYFAMLNNQPTTTRADVDQSGTINTTDAMLTLRNSLGLSMNGTNWNSNSTTGDVNCDGTSNSTDAMLILRYSVGLSMSGTNWCVE